MIQENTPQKKEKKIYKVILIVLIAMAAISGARKDFNDLMAFVSDAESFADRWFGGILPTAQARTNDTCTVVKVARVSKVSNVARVSGAADFQWTGNVAEGKSIEIKGLNGDISAEPANGNQAEVIAVRSSKRSDLESVKVQLVEHANGVTICALYQLEDGTFNTCEPGAGSKNQSTTVNIRNNDVRVDFKVRVPARVGFIGRTVNGEITAASLASNVVTHTVNGSIKISRAAMPRQKLSMERSSRAWAMRRGTKLSSSRHSTATSPSTFRLRSELRSTRKHSTGRFLQTFR
jgi:hypothetical protein